MPYMWNDKNDVDKSVVILKSVLDQDPKLPHLLTATLQGSIRDSDQALVHYFFEEMNKHAPAAIKYFKSQE